MCIRDSGCTEGFRDWVKQNVIGFGDDGSEINPNATGRKIAARAGEVPGNFEPFVLYTGSATQVILSFTYHTTVKVSKEASESWAANDADYTLAGAVYGIYRTRADAEADVNRVASIVTDESGHGESESLGATRETFYAKEVEPSSGYALDESVYEVGPGNDYAFSSEEPPITVRLVLKKLDAETGQGAPQGLSLIHISQSLGRRMAEQERRLTDRMAERRARRRAARDVYAAIGYDLMYENGIAQVEEGLFSHCLLYTSHERTQGLTQRCRPSSFQIAKTQQPCALQGRSR